MITRKQYVDFKGDKDDRATMHQAFYAQFASAAVVNFVAGQFGPEELVNAYKADSLLNTIELKRWDDAARAIYPWLDQELLKATGQFWSLSTGVCTCKAAAKILISRYTAQPGA